MRILTLALILPFLLVGPSADAAPQIKTGITLAAAQKDGVILFEARRYEESPHGPVLATGYVVLQVKSEKTNWHWKAAPSTRRLAYKGRARWFFNAPPKSAHAQIRAVSIGGGGYRQSYSKPVKLPL